jgi:hypothetical protein
LIRRYVHSISNATTPDGATASRWDDARSHKPKPKAPAKSKENDIGSFIQQLIGLASYVHQLQVQAHLIALQL